MVVAIKILHRLLVSRIGDGKNYDLAEYNEQSILTNANSLDYVFLPGFKDIGAYEYLGGTDSTPPVIINTNPEFIHQAVDSLSSTDSIRLFFDEPLLVSDALAPANYRLTGAGPNGVSG